MISHGVSPALQMQLHSRLKAANDQTECERQITVIRCPDGDAANSDLPRMSRSITAHYANSHHIYI
jgi:hypothetical protein